MKFNKKILPLVFFALVLVLVLRRTVFRESDQSFREVIGEFDPSQIDEISMNIPETGTYTLHKVDTSWEISNTEMRVKAKEGSADALLQELHELPVKQLISKNPDKWTEYELDQSRAKVIKLFERGNEKLSLEVGRFSFDQQRRTGESYVRISGEEEVYSVDGFLALSVGRDFNSFRITGLTDFSPESIHTFSLRGNEKDWVFDRTLDGDWQCKGMDVDSASVAKYLTTLADLNGRDFNDSFRPEENTAWRTLTIGEDNRLDIYMDSVGKFVFYSNHNEACCDSDSSGIFSKAIVALEKLIESN